MKSVKSLFATILLLVVLAIGIVGIFAWKAGWVGDSVFANFFPNAAYETALDKGDQARRAGQSLDAETYLSQSLANAKTLAEKSQARLVLAVNKLSRKDVPSDQSEGIAQLIVLSSDPTVGPSTRSSALVNIAQWLNTKSLTRIESTLASSSLSSILSDSVRETAASPWKDVLGTEAARRDFSDYLAIQKIFDRSNTLYRNYIAEYWVGAWYAARAVQLDAHSQFSKERDAMLLLAREHVKNGDAVFAQNVTDGYSYSTQLMYGYNVRGQAGLRIYSLTHDAQDLAGAEKALQSSLDAYATDPYQEQDKWYQADAFFFRMIALGQDSVAQPGALDVAVQQFLTLDNETLSDRISTLRYVNNPSYVSRTSFDHSSVVQVASKSQKFKTFLFGIGWKEADFK